MIGIVEPSLVSDRPVGQHAAQITPYPGGGNAGGVSDEAGSEAEVARVREST